MPNFLVTVHLVTVLPAAILGAYILLVRKGGVLHRSLGKGYMVLMAFTAVWTLFMPAFVGPRLLNHFGLLHLLSLLTAWTVPNALRSARRGDVRAHKRAMLMLYFGGVIAAGGFALFVPGRYLHSVVFQDSQLDY